MTEQKELYATFDEDYAAGCCRGDIPGCASACPFLLDVRDFISKTTRGSLDAAVKTYRNAVIFPRIVAEICPAPCQDVCPRGKVDTSIDLHSLERTAVKLARSLDPINFNVPAKKQTVAVIGAGVSGLACAIRLAAKKYSVTVFEKSDRIGGHLWDIMDPEIFMDDFATQGKYVSYELKLNHEIKSLDEVKDFDVVYIATGKGGENFGLTADGDGNPVGGPDGVFIGGGVLGADTVWAIVQAANAAINMEKHIMTGFMKFPPEKRRDTRIDIQTELIEASPKIQPDEHGVYTKEQAKEEAARCLRCDCSRCLDKCEFMQYWRLYPKQIANFMAFGLGDMNLEPKSHNRMVNACTGCGVCQEVCPHDVPNGDQMMAVRRRMYEKKMIPPAYHYYWVNDMEEACSEDAYLLLPPADGSQPKYLLFPGCQLGASDPRYPKALYELMLKAEPATGLLLTCCGAPAYWAGDKQRHQELLDDIRQVWQEQGRPTIVCACLTCLRLFRQYAPDLDSVSLYQVLADAKLELPQYGDKEYALVDPCAAKFIADSRESVQKLLEQMNVPNQVLYPNIKEMPCCSFGGNVYGADPGMAKQMRKNRVEADPRPYITYCSNCRDIFAGEGKETVHLLDLLTGLNDGNRPAPHISQRRANRIKAKALALNKEVSMPKPMFELDIPEDVQAHMDECLIYEADVCKVIAYSEENNSKFVDDNGVCIGHLAIGLPTIWVEYKKLAEGRYKVYDCYMHRMTVIEPDRDYSDCINNVLEEKVNG